MMHTPSASRVAQWHALQAENMERNIKALRIPNPELIAAYTAKREYHLEQVRIWTAHSVAKELTK